MKTRSTEFSLSTLQSTDVVLTVNRRLASYLRQQYDGAQAKLGKEAWYSTSILPLHSWLEMLWENSSDVRVVLNEGQEILLWESIICRSREEFSLLNHHSTAFQVKEAFALLQNWCVDLSLCAQHARTETLIFMSWMKQFQEQCETNGWISRSCLPNLLLERLQNKKQDIASARVIFSGFDDFSPFIIKLVDVLKDSHEIIYWTPTAVADSVGKLSCIDLNQELTTMARWAYQCLIETDTISIGCVIPQLAILRDEVARVFDDVYHSMQLQDKYSSPPYNISAAKALAHYPLICTALHILKAGLGEIKMDELSYLLRSPFLAGAEKEMHTRALLDANLRLSCEQRLYINELTQRVMSIRGFFSETCTIWFHNLQRFLAYIESLPQKTSYQNWANHISKLLELLGWPSERTLDSDEFQQLERWRLLLAELTTLDLVSENISYKTAIIHLQQLAERTLFQSKTEASAPIQILGMLESAGMVFDALWIQGLDNETWPAPANPNSFIPIELQRKFLMPHASSEREVIFSQTLTSRFCESAIQVIFSYALQEGDKPLSQSPLIAHFPPIDLYLPAYIARNQRIFQTSQLESLVDEQGPPILDDTFVRGGTSLFKSQAICPFKAFAEIRLNATCIDHPHFGLALHERGSLLHIILAKIWPSIKNHATLMDYSEEALDEVISNVIDEALQNFQSLKPIIIQPRFLKIEKQRLKKLIVSWLVYEKKRLPFTVIDCESRLQTHIFGFEISLQIDRIDQLEDGKYLIIDYKTGKSSVMDWFGERPEEPQLPLYCLTSSNPISGIAFAQVRADQLQFKGITADKNVLPDVATIDSVRHGDQSLSEWNHLIDVWQGVLENLAEQFRCGIATVDPKDAIKSCQYCHLHELCRVHANYFISEGEV